VIAARRSQTSVRRAGVRRAQTAADPQLFDAAILDLPPEKRLM
jgi:hypothetical protein